LNSSTNPNLERVQGKTMNVAYLLGLLVLAGTGIWLISKVTLAANLLIVSILVAYLISPLVDFFCNPIVLRLPWSLEFQCFGPRRLVLPPGLSPRRLTLLPRGMPRLLAISVVYLILGLLLGFVMTWLVPVVQKEFHALVGNLGPLLTRLENLLHDLLLRFEQHFPNSLPPWLDPEHFRLAELAIEMQRIAPDLVLTGGTGLFTSFMTALGLVAAFLLVPLLTFYILMDAGRYRKGFLHLIPPHRRAEAQVLMNRIDGTLGRYIRGQLIVIFSVTITITVALELLGVEYALLIGLFAGVTEVIPYAGVVMGLIPAFLIALLKGGLWFAILVVVVMEIIHWLQGHIVVPAVMGHSVNLPPLTVMMALLAGFELGGIMGMVVAIPLAGIARVVIMHRLEIRDARAAEVKALTEGPATSPAGQEHGLLEPSQE
jgi:predicted PurR-regulated permease PerM